MVGTVEPGSIAICSADRREPAEQVEEREAQRRHGVLDVVPKIHRNSMLPSEVQQPPCRNIAVTSVSHAATAPVRRRRGA